MGNERTKRVRRRTRLNWTPWTTLVTSWSCLRARGWGTGRWCDTTGRASTRTGEGGTVIVGFTNVPLTVTLDFWQFPHHLLIKSVTLTELKPRYLYKTLGRSGSAIIPRAILGCSLISEARVSPQIQIGDLLFIRSFTNLFCLDLSPSWYYKKVVKE